MAAVLRPGQRGAGAKPVARLKRKWTAVGQVPPATVRGNHESLTIIFSRNRKIAGERGQSVRVRIIGFNSLDFHLPSEDGSYNFQELAV